MSEEIKQHQNLEQDREQCGEGHRVSVTVDHEAHLVYPGPYPVSTFKEIVHVASSNILEEIVNDQRVKLEDAATMTVSGGEAFASRLSEHKVDITVDDTLNRVFPGPYVVSTFKEIVHVPNASVLEESKNGNLWLLPDDDTIVVKGGEIFLSSAKDTLRVVVRYPAAKEPYRDNRAHRTETVASLKSRVLTAFGLTEGQQGGQTFTYTLYHHKRPLDNLSETLGQVAGDERTLELKLSQQITQG